MLDRGLSKSYFSSEHRSGCLFEHNFVATNSHSERISWFLIGKNEKKQKKLFTTALFFGKNKKNY